MTTLSSPCPLFCLLTQLYLGGNPNQTRLAELFADRVKVKDLETFLEPVFVHYRDHRKPKEAFGDYIARTGFPALKEFQAGYVSGAHVGGAAGNGAATNGNGHGNGKAALAVSPTTLAVSSSCTGVGEGLQGWLADSGARSWLLKYN